MPARATASHGRDRARGSLRSEETHLDRVAKAFAEAGLASLVFDNRNFGAANGQPRHEIDPWQQVSDDRAAITYAITRPEVDRDRIGIWGSSYSGCEVLVGLTNDAIGRSHSPEGAF